MEIHVPYGHTQLSAILPDNYVVESIEAVDTPALKNPELAVRKALDDLIGDVKWSDFIGAHSVAIAVNDKTRPVPHSHLLPPLLEQLNSLGIPDEAIRFFVAGGTHVPMEAEEFPLVLPGDLSKRYRVVVQDAETYETMVNLGETSRGTPVWMNSDYVASDLKIVVGNIEPHQFAGFSGGVKSAAVGLAGLKTINFNHSLMSQPDAVLGEYEKNPVRQDIEEIGRKAGIQLALDAVLNQEREIVHVLAGEPQAVMRAGVPVSRKVCQAIVHHRYDLIIASPGGYPKDINVYQAQKALAHAALISREGSTIILAAACPEGAGSLHFEEWVHDKHSYEEVIKAFSDEGFRIGPHKAFLIARDALKRKLLFCSGLSENQARSLLLTPVRDLQTAVDLAVKSLNPGDHIGVMPHASSTIPFLEDDLDANR